MPVYNNSRRLDTALKNLENVDITDKNKQDIKDFLHYIASYGVSIGRQCKYIYPLENIARWIGKDFITATKENIQVLVEYIDMVKKGDDEPQGISKVKRYIDIQEEHHRTHDFEAELKILSNW